MCNDKQECAVLEEQRLDTLLRLAFEYDAMEETRQIMSECTGELSPKDEAICRRAYASFLRKLARLERRERRTYSLRFTARTWKVAVCMVVLLVLAVPWAIAHTDFLRVNPSRLEIRKKADYIEVEMKEDTSVSFDVPSQWLGRYYLSYVPEGFELFDIFPEMNSVEYRNVDGKAIRFDECPKGSASNINNENAVCSYERVNGESAYVIDRENSAFVIWGIGTEYFIVYGDLPKEEVLKIAESVEFIQ
ncbi:MAG: DUF4367 domain-containing protein [Eubacteriales bacterium]|nr:DUF4367 domain-containing protein [Eubacteriales bacterium]